MHAAILLIGGKSERFLDPNTPKQFQSLSGKRVFVYALETLLKTGTFSQILLPCHPDWIEPLELELTKLSPKISIFEGGSTRQESVYKSLEHLDFSITKVLVHDGARPFMTKRMIHELLDSLDHTPAAGTYIPSSDTIGVTDGESVVTIPKRSTMVRGQTPQGFQKWALLEVHNRALESNITNATCDITLALDCGLAVKKIEGDEINIKITTPLDLYIAEQLLRLKQPYLEGEKFDSLEGKTFALFGASGGIGHPLQIELENRGAHVIPLSRTSTPYSVDLKNRDSILAVCEEINGAYKALDGCIFAAGVLKRGDFNDLSTEEVEQMVRINFTSLIPILQNLSLKQNGSCILIASSSYYRGRKELAVYSATKAASVNLLQGFAEERPDLNIQIICPARADTPLRKENFPDEDNALLLNPNEIAKSILSHLISPTISPKIINIQK
ncbi:MAG: SDR family NAD(P)-dependent oxidoreductase [Chlamydiia bacterium]